MLQAWNLVSGNCKMQYVSKLNKMVKMPLSMSNAYLLLKGAPNEPPMSQFQKPEFWLWSQLAGKLFVPPGDFWNKVCFWFHRLRWSVPIICTPPDPTSDILLIPLPGLPSELQQLTFCYYFVYHTHAHTPASGESLETNSIWWEAPERSHMAKEEARGTRFAPS